MSDPSVRRPGPPVMPGELVLGGSASTGEGPRASPVTIMCGVGVVAAGTVLAATTSTAPLMIYDPTDIEHSSATLVVLITNGVDATDAAASAWAFSGAPSEGAAVSVRRLVWGPNVTTAEQRDDAVARLRAQGVVIYP